MLLSNVNRSSVWSNLGSGAGSMGGLIPICRHLFPNPPGDSGLAGIREIHVLRSWITAA